MLGKSNIKYFHLKPEINFKIMIRETPNVFNTIKYIFVLTIVALQKLVSFPVKHQITPIYGHEYSIKSLTLRGKVFGGFILCKLPLECKTVQ